MNWSYFSDPVSHEISSLLCRTAYYKHHKATAFLPAALVLADRLSARPSESLSYTNLIVHTPTHVRIGRNFRRKQFRRKNFRQMDFLSNGHSTEKKISLKEVPLKGIFTERRFCRKRIFAVGLSAEQKFRLKIQINILQRLPPYQNNFIDCFLKLTANELMPIEFISHFNVNYIAAQIGPR